MNKESKLISFGILCSTLYYTHSNIAINAMINEDELELGFTQINLNEEYSADAIDDGQTNVPISTANEITVGWFSENGVWYYRNDNGELHTGWLQEGNKKYYLKSDGSMATQWECIDGSWYYFYDSGSAVTGWLEKNGDWYYFNKDGKSVTGWIEDKGKKYYMKSDGTMANGWELIGGSWYHFYDSGSMTTGWLQKDNKWYYLEQDGKMKTGWLKKNNEWYYLYESGSMATGWLQLDNTWYYLASDGRMVTGWQKISDKWYYFMESGKMKTGWLQEGNDWYFLYESGSMATGWLQLGDTWYYLRPNGKMVTGVEKINGVIYYFNSSGKMEKELSDDFNMSLYNQAINSGKSVNYALNYAMYPNVKTNFYGSIKTVANPNSITVLVNKNYRLPSNYEPSDLVYLDVPLYSAGTGNKANYMRKEAASALKSLFNAAKSEKGYRLVARSGYRSYQTQQSLYNRYVSTDGQAAADLYSARPGHSEHQTGLAIDITSPSVNNELSETFGKTPEGKWVAQNAHRFGFIIRYPEGRQSEVGYQYEPWHLRYVGVDIATEMYKKGMIYEDYVLEYGLIPATK